MGGEFLDAVIAEIGDENVPGAVDGNTGRGRKPAIERAGGIEPERAAPSPEIAAVGAKGLHPVVIGVGDVEGVAMPSRRRGLRSPKGPRGKSR